MVSWNLTYFSKLEILEKIPEFIFVSGLPLMAKVRVKVTPKRMSIILTLQIVISASSKSYPLEQYDDFKIIRKL